VIAVARRGSGTVEGVTKITGSLSLKVVDSSSGSLPFFA
jgi:hypothetical protein